MDLPGRNHAYQVLDQAEVARIQELRRRYPQSKSAILPALWILQRKEGILTAEGMREVARAMELPAGAVEAVASFYSMYFFKPHGRYVVEMCTNLSCLLMGSARIMKRFEDQLGCAVGATTEDGTATLMEVECIGACGAAPAAQINHRFFESLTEPRVDGLVADMKAGRLDLHQLPTGREVSAHRELVDLANPGANRVPLPSHGSAGSVIDLVKGASNLIPGREHPADRGYTEAPEEPPDVNTLTHARLTRDIEAPGLATLQGYRDWGGYRAIEIGARMRPGEIAAAVTDSGLRGRGGAGFPTGRKWTLMPQGKHPRYLVANADESEPGTFKDRYLMERNPHLVIEGIILAARAVEADQAFIYVRGEYAEVQGILERALAEAYEANLCGERILGGDWGIDVVIHGGAGAYICGEENGLLESLTGNRGRPRPKPPYFPAAIGVYDAPTALNNVETLANVPFIVERGPEEFKSVGTEQSTGTRMICLSGHVNRPGVYEVPQGIPAMALIDDLGGGMLGGKQLKAVQPGGSSSQFLTAEQLQDTTMDAESIQAHGSMAGSGAVIVISEDQCIVEYTSRLADFYYRESCGKCTPCREGTFWLSRVVRRIEAGGGRPEDVDLITSVCNNIDGKSLCALGEAAAWPIRSSVQQFAADFQAHVDAQQCPFKDTPVNPTVQAPAGSHAARAAALLDLRD